MSSKKRKYREKISESTGGVLDLFDHPEFRSSVPREPVPARDAAAEDGDDAEADDLTDAPAAEPRPA